MIDFLYIWLPVVFVALFMAAILCIILGITGLGSEDDSEYPKPAWINKPRIRPEFPIAYEEYPDDSADLMPCGHPPREAERAKDGQ